jgi:hypothetical protein
VAAAGDTAGVGELPLPPPPPHPEASAAHIEETMIIEPGFMTHLFEARTNTNTFLRQCRQLRAITLIRPYRRGLQCSLLRAATAANNALREASLQTRGWG